MAIEPRKNPSARPLTQRLDTSEMTRNPVRRPQRLSDEVVAVLRSDIESLRLTPGTRLPTEAELTRSFEVSRTVIREAILRLEADGLLAVRQGSGIYVTDPSEVDRAFRLGAAEKQGSTLVLREAFELRRGIEAESAWLAAQRHVESDLHAFTASYRELERLTELQIKNISNVGDAVAEADIIFHDAVLKMAGNDIMLRFSDFLSSIFAKSVRSARLNSTSYTQYMQEALTEHRRIYKAIIAKDAEAARDAMRAHLDGAQRRLELF